MTFVLCLLVALIFNLHFECTLGQTVKANLRTCQVEFKDGDKIQVEVFIGTQGLSQQDLNTMLLKSVIFTGGVSNETCSVTMTGIDCISPNFTACGYCERTVDSGFLLVFTTFHAYDQYVINWDTVQDELYFSENLFDKRSYFSWQVIAQYKLTNVYIPKLDRVLMRTSASMSDKFLTVYLSPYDTIYMSAMNFTIVTAPYNNTLVVITDKPNCQYVCDSIESQFNLNSIQVTFQNVNSSTVDITVRNLTTVALVNVIGTTGEVIEYSIAERYLIYRLHGAVSSQPASYDLIMPFNWSRCSNQNVWDPTVTSVLQLTDCPSGQHVKKGHIQKGLQARCSCQFANQISLLDKVQWFDSYNNVVSLPGVHSDLMIPPNAVNGTIYLCYDVSVKKVGSGIPFTVLLYDIPTVDNFTANGIKSHKINVGDNVTFYCKVKSDLPANALLVGSGLGRVLENASSSEVLELSLPAMQCEDAGRYYCTGQNGFEDKFSTYPDYIDLNITCAIKYADKRNAMPTTEMYPSENTVITLSVYGYPEPTNMVLKLETGSAPSHNYSAVYIYLVPPFGAIKLTIHDANTKGTTTYILNVTNQAGVISLKFQVVKKYPWEIDMDIFSQIFSSDLIKGAAGGGGGLILLITCLCCCCCCCRRKPKPQPRPTNADINITPDTHNDHQNTTNDYIEPM